MTKTTISEGLVIEGDIVGKGQIDVRGKVIGDIRAAGVDILVGGHVEGRIEVESADIRGTLKGSLATRTLGLHAQAVVDADVSAQEMTAERGARVKGQISIG